MKALAVLFVFALIVVFACAQMPTLLPDSIPTVVAELPTMESAAAAPDDGDGSGLARVSPTTDPGPGAPDNGGGPADAQQVTPQTATPLPPTATPTATPDLDATATAETAPGALIQISMPSEVGVLLDELPAGMRDRVAQTLLDESQEEWLARARRQVQLTRLRLNFRDSNEPGKGQLPLTQPDQWSIALDDDGPQRRIVQGHDLVMIGYTFTTTILTDPQSVALSEPRLGDVGGVWEEYFILPADPELLLQRTGRACLNTAGFPPNSVDSQNAGHFFDYDRQNCFNVLASRVGAIETRMRFERLPWDADLADRVRTELPITGEGADLAVVRDDLNVNYLSYRYITESDCALQEGAVGEAGWRRLLQFEATVHNVGDAPMHIGFVSAGGEESVFKYAPCHDHIHYRNYGIFTLDDGQQSSSKQAFCVQSTDRASNHELSPLYHEYSCRFQGIQTGWVDEYIAGLDTQWIDITGVDVGDEGRTVQLGFVSNPEGFLCEGEAAFDDNGQLLWEPSGHTTEDGEPILRPQCEFVEDWDANNVETIELFVPPTGSFVTAPCAHGQLGPVRDCGFEELTLEPADATCTVGQPFDVSLTPEEDSAPMAVRACERSAALGSGVACPYDSALANVVVDQDTTTMSFNCPAVRDGEATQGNFSLYAAPLWPQDEGAVSLGD